MEMQMRCAKVNRHTRAGAGENPLDVCVLNGANVQRSFEAATEEIVGEEPDNPARAPCLNCCVGADVDGSRCSVCLHEFVQS